MLARRGDLGCASALGAALLACALAACASAPAKSAAPAETGTPDDETGFTIPDSTPGIDYPDSMEGRVAARLAGCSGVEPGCHAAPGSAGLVLGRTPAQDFAQLLGVRSTERPDLARVEPGAPSRSWLYLKVLGARDAGVDSPMPLGSEGDPAFAAQLQAWIAAGAKDPFADAGP